MRTFFVPILIKNTCSIVAPPAGGLLFDQGTHYHGKLLWEHYNPKHQKPVGLRKGFKKKKNKRKENHDNPAALMAKPCKMCAVSDR